jgi:uncharacterized protein (TIGR00299 family) protein
VTERPALHIHLDPLGGLAGDMFLAAVLDAWPRHRDGMEAAVRAAGLPAEVQLDQVPARDHALTGSRYLVDLAAGDGTRPTGPYRDIARRLRAAPLEAAVRERALAIFGLLAQAEGQVHGVAADDVVFHELAGWDSIADILGAAFLIETLGAQSWSVAPVPVGRGRVMTAHGPLPVPAPATLKLLEGFPVIDDGIEGERVTPTGAAILRHLEAKPGLPHGAWRPARSGIGFGSRTLKGISNVVRLTAYESASVDDRVGAPAGEEVAVLSFEVDDQTPEDLAVGLDGIRAREGVLDVIQIPALGKKGRMTMSIQVLCRPDALERAIEACFSETTTIGLRWRWTQRRVLDRASLGAAEVGDPPVKVVERPGGTQTAKAEIDAVRSQAGGTAARGRRRRRAESRALEASESD